MANASKFTTKLALRKVTKGTYVYENPGDGLILYFPKDLSVFAGTELDNPPSQLTMTLDAK